MEDIVMEVARRFVAFDEQERSFDRSAYLVRSNWDGVEFRGREEPHRDGDGDVLWRRVELGPAQTIPPRTKRFVPFIDFMPMPDWTFVLEELSIGDGSMICYRLVRMRWQCHPSVPRHWVVKHRNMPVEVHGGDRGAPRLVVGGEDHDAIYVQEDTGLRIAAAGYMRRTGRLRGISPKLPEPPEIQQLEAPLTASGRAEYLHAAREWSERYLAACETWAKGFEGYPEFLPLDGDAYVHGDLRIPKTLFDFQFLMTQLIGKLDTLLKRVSPPNKYVAPAAR